MSPFRKPVALAGLLVLLATACASTAMPEIRYAGGDGSVPSWAVVILGAATELEFRAAEEAWIRQSFPGASLESGDYVIGPCACHAVKITAPDNAIRTVYFDMSALGR